VLLAIEIGLVDSEGVDELLDLAAHTAVQAREIAGEGSRAGRRHPLVQPALDVIALGFAEQHAGAAIQEIAQPRELVFGHLFSQREGGR